MDHCPSNLRRIPHNLTNRATLTNAVKNRIFLDPDAGIILFMRPANWRGPYTKWSLRWWSTTSTSSNNCSLHHVRPFLKFSLKNHPSICLLVMLLTNTHLSPHPTNKTDPGGDSDQLHFLYNFQIRHILKCSSKICIYFFLYIADVQLNACDHIIYVVGAGNNDRKIGCILYFFIIIYSIQSGYKQLYILERTYLTFDHCSFMVL